MKHIYKITGMHCGACIEKVQKALEAVPYVEKVEVTLNPQQTVITMKQHIETEKLNAAVKSAGKYSLEENNEIHSVSAEPLNPFAAVEEEKSKLATFTPLIIITIYHLGFVILSEVNYGEFRLMHVMNNFMGGFFIIFSFFKFLNLSGFADTYSTYDIIAKRWRGYGFIYPFIELSLGVSFLFHAFPKTTNIITLFVMSISSIGVIQSVLKKNKIKCACLGTVFNLPMTTITIIEDLLMVIMSIIMLIYI
ncbi:MAG: cation transporter [Ignavibacteria bacterium]|jgi:copper chaperone CopZ|nr:cation transporter [Ignavibacteria bacterium]